MRAHDGNSPIRKKAEAGQESAVLHLIKITLIWRNRLYIAEICSRTMESNLQNK